MASQVLSLEIFSKPSLVRSHVNEDAWFLLESPRYPQSITFGVIDGAGLRKSLPDLIDKIKSRFPKLTPAAYASHLLKVSLEEQLRNEPACSLRTALLRSNDFLRSEITKVIGTFDAEEIVQMLGAPLSDDPRNVRLVLPACVATLARLDQVLSKLEYAHVGDTALFELRSNEDVIRHTRDQMGPFDAQAFESILVLQKNHQLAHFKDAVSSSEGREFIIQSGLKLNYVDYEGKTDPRHGCGVLNGLPEMEDYIESGVIDVDITKTLGFFILSDGLELLAPLHEDVVHQQQRYRKIGHMIRKAGLRGLYNEMMQMASSDVYLDSYPRTKLQDDATGVYLEVNNLTD